VCVGSELIGRHRSSWLPEGEAPPPYRGALTVHRQLSQPLRAQQSFPDLPTFGYRLVVLAVQTIILTNKNYFLLHSTSFTYITITGLTFIEYTFLAIKNAPLFLCNNFVYSQPVFKIFGK